MITGSDNSNKRCFRTKPKLFRESGDISGNRDTWKFFRDIRDNSVTLQKEIGTSKEISGNVSELSPPVTLLVVTYSKLHGKNHVIIYT